MDIMDRVKKIIMNPAVEWQVIKEENLTIADMFKQYAVILAIIPAAAGFIGRTMIGMSVWGVSTRVSFFDGLAWAILSYVMSLGGIFVLGYIIDALAPTFGCKKDLNASMKTAVFSMTAGWLAGIFSLIPALSILGIVGLYTFYLYYIGLRELKNVPPDKLVGYYVVTLVLGLVVFLVMGILVAAFTAGAYSGSYSGN